MYCVNIMNMRLKNKLILVILLLLTISAKSQISGYIVDSLSTEAMQYCTVILSDTSNKIIDIKITNEKGLFVLNCLDTGVFNLKINFYGYKTHEKKIVVNYLPETLDTILLSPDLKEIEKIVVKGNISGYKDVADKTVVTLSEHTIKSKPNIYAALRTVSGIIVDSKTKDISVMGSNKTLILINGIVKNSFDVSELKSKDIEKIEIITNPGSKYESEYTAVINIVTKQLLQKGFSADISSECYYPLIYNFTDVNIQYGFDKIKIFGLYHLFYRGSSDLTVSKTEGNDFTIIDSLYDNSKRNQTQHFFKIGMDYFINKNNFLSIFGYYGFYKQYIPQNYNVEIFKNNTLENKSLLTKYNNSLNNGSNLSIYFKHNFTEKIIYDFYITYNKTFIDISKLSSGNINQLTLNQYYIQNNEFVFNKKSLWVFSNLKFNISKFDFEFGTNYYYRDIMQESSVIDSSVFFNAYENRAKTFLSLSKKLNKISINSAISTELYKNQDYDKYKLFLLPSISLSYKINSKNSFSVSYAKKIEYPDTRQIQSYFIYTTDSLTFYINNDELNISKIDRAQFSYSFFNNSFYFKNIFFFDFNKNPIQKVITNEGIYTFITDENIGYSYKYGVQLMSNFTFFDQSFTINPSLNLYNLLFSYHNITNSDWAFDFNLYLDYFFENGLDFFVNFYYETKKPIFGGYKTMMIPFFDFGISKSFLNDALSLTIDFNPFNDLYQNKYLIGQTTILENDTEYYRNVYLLINYNFSKGKLLKSNRNNTIDKDF